MKLFHHDVVMITAVTALVFSEINALNYYLLIAQGLSLRHSML